MPILSKHVSGEASNHTWQSAEFCVYRDLAALYWHATFCSRACDVCSCCGLLHLQKLPSLNALGPPIPDITLFIIRHKRRRLAIQVCSAHTFTVPGMPCMSVAVSMLCAYTRELLHTLQSWQLRYVQARCVQSHFVRGTCPVRKHVVLHCPAHKHICLASNSAACFVVLLHRLFRLIQMQKLGK